MWLFNTFVFMLLALDISRSDITQYHHCTQHNSSKVKFRTDIELTMTNLWLSYVVTFVSSWEKRTQDHYNDVIMGAIASQITSLTIVYSIVIPTQINENIKAPRHWPLCGEFTGDRWIPRTNGRLRGKWFHLMTSSYIGLALYLDNTSWLQEAQP